MTIKKLIVLILLAAGIYYLHEHRPTYAEHAARVYQVYSGETLPAGEELPPWPQWEKLEFRDFFLLTATQDADTKTLVSYGCLSYIKVLDEDFGKKIFRAAERAGGE